MKFTRHIPNMLTLINLLIGCIAIVYIFYDHVTLKFIYSPSTKETAYFDGKFILEKLHFGKLYIAALLVFAAAIFDYADGFAARLLNAKSELGKQLDTLADMVTFGLVPGLIMYFLLSVSFVDTAAAFNFGIILFIPAFALTLCAALRLGKFNIDTRQTENFIGLPTPSMAVFVASLPLILFFDEAGLGSIILNPWVLYAITALLAWLMVSSLPIMSMKIKKDDPKKLKMTAGFVIFCVLLLLAGYFVFDIFFLLIPVIIILYIIFSLIINSQKA